MRKLVSNLIAAASAAVCLAPWTSWGAEFDSVVQDNGVNTYWDWTATWSLVSGSDADGIPDSDDSVTLIPRVWAEKYNIYCTNAGWTADSVFIRAIDGNQHTFGISAPGTIGTLIYSNTVANQYSWKIGTGATTLHLTEYLDTGTSVPNTHWENNASTWAFTNDAVFQYPTLPFKPSDLTGWPEDYVDNPDTFFHIAARYDFSGADSVTLRRNPNMALHQEVITTAKGNLSNPMVIGRADGGDQTWTADGGAHPLLMPGGSSQDAGFSKVGSGDVLMPDVDLMLDLSNAHTADDGDAISAGGTLSGGLYSGEILANSLRVTMLAPITKDRRAAVLGVLRLDGESRQQAGATGTGRALDVEVVGNYTNEFEVQAGSSSIIVGQVIAEPGAGAFYFARTGTVGIVKVNVNNDSRDVHTYTNTSLLIANDLILGPGSYLHDRNDWQDNDSNAGGGVAFRQDLVIESTLTNQWRWEHTVVRAISGGTNEAMTIECPSADNGTAGPGTANFELGTLVLGQDETNGTGTVLLLLADGYDNHTASAGAEALYVDNLRMYAGSRLGLNGHSLYVKNSGSWEEAVPGPFAYGDGTGAILREWPPGGSVFMVK